MLVALAVGIGASLLAQPVVRNPGSINFDGTGLATEVTLAAIETIAGAIETATEAVASAVSAGVMQVNVAEIGGVAVGTSACDDDSKLQTVPISSASAGNVQLVALAASEVITVCSFNVVAGGTVAWQLIYGTGTACATGETDITGAYPLVANSGLVVPNTGFAQAKTAASNALCMELSAGTQVDGLLGYVQQ